ncbi:two-component regulator propeller domain-containing protein [Sphingobacterium sp. MYb382]|uniref:two-component regulator propeller domain-containing protein n=1 Tax=Sphingobacterium sp. MYb382 TaxID=2745278 RepID=UPI0030B3BA0A
MNFLKSLSLDFSFKISSRIHMRIYKPIFYLLYFCFIYSLSCSHLLLAQPVSYRFNEIGLNKGLSSSRITAIAKGPQGFLWFGTASGLNRYDGYGFKVFLHKEGDSTTINDNFIDQILTGPMHSLWVYTPKGWNKFDTRTEKFSSRPKAFLQSIGMPHEWFKTMVDDGKGNYWFLYKEGLYKYNSITGKTESLNVKSTKTPLHSNSIAAMAFNSQGNFWLIYADGMLELRAGHDYRLLKNIQLFTPGAIPIDYRLFVDKENELWFYVPGQKLGSWWFNPETGNLQAVNTRSLKWRLNNDIVNGIVQDDKGAIWIATDHGGVNLIDKKKDGVRYLDNVGTKKGANYGNAIQSILKDDRGTIWMGTFKTGISYFNERKSAFFHVQNEPGNKNSLPFDDVNCFAEDRVGNLWIGTNGRGLLYYDRKTETYRQFLSNSASKNSLSNDVISSLFVDRDNKLWIGTYFGGLNCYDGNNFTRYDDTKNDSLGLSDDSIWEIFEDSKGRLWLGTLRNGLQQFDRAQKKFISYRYPHPFPFSINTIMEDRKGNIWAGGTAGIELYNPVGKLIRRFTHLENDTNSLSNNTVLDILEDKKGSIWIGTRDGLNIYQPKTDKFVRYRTEDGLPHHTILRILEDKQQQFWLSTPNGICNMISKPGGTAFIFRNYDETDGLQGRVFNDDAALLTRKGELLFGGSNGFNILHPPFNHVEKVGAALVFTDLQLFNNSVVVGQRYDGREILPESITSIKELVLNHDQNAFAIEFAALNYLDAGKVNYAYQMKGFHNTWINTDGNNRKISFTGLTPGTYTLSIKARDENGDWYPESANLRILIKPPFWASGWAYGIYVLSILGALFYGRYRIVRKAQLKFEKEQEIQEGRRREELNAMKLHFFTNVSHEFKTPLALILAPVEKLLSQYFPEREQKQFKLIHRNARRLLNMVEELLDFRKLELGELKLNIKKVSVMQIGKEVYDSFVEVAERKHIHFTFQGDDSELMGYFDADKLERILFNLLSNAFKFTPNGGSVSLVVQRIIYEDTDFVEIKVQDSGIGIPSDKLEQVFERFFQHELPGNMLNQGSGIGLSISKEFAELHGGRLYAQSEEGNGATFFLLLPIGKAFFEHNRQELVQTVAVLEPLALVEPSITKAEPAERLIHQQWAHKTILLVEDNDDYRFYIKESLKEYFNVVEASNGKEGWQKALAEHPDLIVSDVDMPEMNGMQLCQKVKQDSRTSFIPFILLTVMASEITQLKGLDFGANDYITKPFNADLLVLKIRNLLAQQDKFKETYQKQVRVAAAEPAEDSTDAEFIQKALVYVERNLANSDLSVQELGKELLLGRATLYRKIFALTGQTPVEFIRSIRLQRAKQLLEKGQLTVAEIAYEVGFTDPKYFTKVFKETFQYTPSAYQQAKRKKED